MNWIKSGAGKVVMAAAVLLGAWNGYCWYTAPSTVPIWPVTSIHAQAPAQAQGDTFVSNEVVKFAFTVANGYATKGPVVLLGDKPNYQDPAALTVAVNKTQFARELGAAAGDGKLLHGHYIEGSGRKGMYRGRPQIVADSIVIK